MVLIAAARAEDDVGGATGVREAALRVGAHQDVVEAVTVDVAGAVDARITQTRVVSGGLAKEEPATDEPARFLF